MISTSPAPAPDGTSPVGADLPARTAFAPAIVVGRHQGPAALIGPDGAILAANPPGDALRAALREEGRDTLHRLAQRAVADGAPRQERIQIRLAAARCHFDLTALPLNGGSVLVLGNDVTVDQGLISALTASRQLFKDLVTCSSDFAWETDPRGIFNYVSTRGALGYRAVELAGRAAETLLTVGLPRPDALPFVSRNAVDEAEVWLDDADGIATCLLVSSVPVHDEDGQWVGARGVCRDVTVERARAAALAQAEQREHMERRIVAAIRDEVAPERVLDVAARTIAETLRAADVQIVRACEIGAGSGSGPGLDDPTRITVACDHGGEHKGLIVARREAGAWRQEDRDLLRRIAIHVAIAIARIEHYEILSRLSRTDELTGLLNRRAFLAELEVRLGLQQRTGRPGAVIYVDLDNFKLVNDRFGHARGDAVLSHLAGLLARDSRVGDLAARLGGDEFVLWLEDTDQAGAVAKANALLAQVPEINDLIPAADFGCGLSIGIAVRRAGPAEPLAEFLTRADAAMYAAKRGGKGRYRIAPPAGPAPRA